MKYQSTFQIRGKKIGKEHPTYFIADIAANHDGDLQRAKDLIYLAAECGADAAKFQHFRADTIVSDHGFKTLGGQQSHQANWNKSVYQVYEAASLNIEWTPVLKETCDKAGITFFTSPYSFELVDRVDPYVPAYKIGSGDITWLDVIEHISKKRKPVILASGASSSDEVHRAVQCVLEHHDEICVMQCNTNYTASMENFKFINLNVLKTYENMYPNMVLGLSDHTPGHSTVLGAIALGARVIEKHFTDGTKRVGPDHGFSMDPKTWQEMVVRTRELELSLGNGVKQVEENEKETVVVQRRALRLKQDLSAATVLQMEHLIPLRPCPSDGLAPYLLRKLVGRELRHDMKSGVHLTWSDLR